MLKALAAALIAALLVPTTTYAQERVTLGFGRLFSNDGIGDGDDRWRTGSYTVSLLRGQRWSGTAPDQFGELLEFRLGAETIAPANLLVPAANDRRYAGILTLGVTGRGRGPPWRGLGGAWPAIRDRLFAEVPAFALGPDQPQSQLG